MYTFLSENIMMILVGGLIFNFLILLILIIYTIRMKSHFKKIKKKYDMFMKNIDNPSIEKLLEENIYKIGSFSEKIKEIDQHINYIERNLMNCLQKVGIVRYNPFDNVGSDLSFSIALLDKNDDGVVISSLYSRESTSTYAKPINKGESKYPLTAEEMQAIDFAKKKIIEGVFDSGEEKKVLKK